MFQLTPTRSVGAVLAVAICTLAAAGDALARHGAQPVSASAPVMSLDDVMVLELEPIVPELLLAEDAATPGNGPQRFALPVEVQASPATHGTWEDLPGGGRVWRLRVWAPGSTDLNLGFARYALPEGATLHLLSEAYDFYQGPFTEAENRKHGQLWTPVVPGDRAVVELYLPADPPFEPVLELGRVGCGYRDLFAKTSDLPKQDTCHIDVVCPEGDPWRDEIRSVGNLQYSGFLQCTGTILMDVPRDFRNFFLTNAFCGVDESNAATVVVYWNFESPTCGQLGGGTLSDTTSGATFRASDVPSDMCLIELDTDPDPDYDVYYSGWDARTTTTPQGGVGIHHPGNDEKAICLNTDPLVSGDNCVGGGGVNSHWWVTEWETGSTEAGAAGSGLWDPATHYLVGYLSGGPADCAHPTEYDCYGKLARGWTAGLSTWLDPGGTGTLRVAGSNRHFVVANGLAQNDHCGGQPGNENGVWEPGELIDLYVEIRGNYPFTGVTGTLSTSTIGVTVSGPNAPWPDLAPGVPASNLTPFEVVVDPGVACTTTVDLELVVNAVEGGPFALVLSQTVGDLLQPDVPAVLPDPGSLESPIHVGQNVTLSDLDVRVQITHSWVGDLTIALRSPQGTEVVLLDRPGVPGSSTGCSDNNLDVTFDDASGVDLESHCAGTTPWYQGVAAPAQPLAAFNGETTAGTWTLIVSDAVAQDSGTLIDWELLSTPVIADLCEVCTGNIGLIFADGFETGDTSAWSTTVP